MQAGLGFNRPTMVLISHLHGDHLLGLPGLLQTMSSFARDKELELFGPVGVAAYLKSLHRTLGFVSTFPVKVRELKPNASVEKNGYKVKTARAKHDITCLGYAIEESDRPGRFHPNQAKRLGVPEGPLWKELQSRKSLKIVYAIDTRPCEAVRRLARDADLLMHDGGFAEDRKDKAKAYYHSTATEAASLAKQCRARRLALVHISAVTRDDSILLREARRVFKQTIVPKDFDVIFLERPK